MKHCAAVGMLCLAGMVSHAQTPALTLKDTIVLSGVQGKFDHFALDRSGHRLFVAATGDHAVEVIDVQKKQIVDSLKGLGKPHGLAWIPETGRLFVADGSKAELDVFSGSPFKLLKSIPLSEDADDMVYDASTSLLYVGHGGTNAANPPSIAVVDTGSLAVIADLRVESHPEGLELDARTDRVFANIADAGKIAVIDGKTHTLIATWKLPSESGNTPLAYDAADGLLLVACRTPARLLALNGKNGDEIASITTDAGADDLFYRPGSKTAVVISGAGFLDSVQVQSSGELHATHAVRTAPGAKTGLLDEETGTLYVGIPGVSQAAAIRVYQVQ